MKRDGGERGWDVMGNKLVSCGRMEAAVATSRFTAGLKLVFTFKYSFIG